MPSLATLPKEVLSQIISYLGYKGEKPDKHTLSQCGRVCKVLYRITREQLFAYICLRANFKPRSQWSRLRELLTYKHKDSTLPPLVSCVRTLEYVICNGSDSKQATALAKVFSVFEDDLCRVKVLNVAFGDPRDSEEELCRPVIREDPRAPPEERDPSAPFASFSSLNTTTQRVILKLAQSTSLEELHLRRLADVPFSLLTSPPNLQGLLLENVAVKLVTPSPETGLTRINEEHRLGSLRGVDISNSSFFEQKSASRTELMQFDAALSRLADLSTLRHLYLAIKKPVQLKKVFLLATNLEDIILEYDDPKQTHCFSLEFLPSSVTKLTLRETANHCVEFKPMKGGRARLNAIDDAVMYPTNIGEAAGL